VSAGSSVCPKYLQMHLPLHRQLARSNLKPSTWYSSTHCTRLSMISCFTTGWLAFTAKVQHSTAQHSTAQHSTAQHTSDYASMQRHEIQPQFVLCPSRMPRNLAATLTAAVTGAQCSVLMQGSCDTTPKCRCQLLFFSAVCQKRSQEDRKLKGRT
jgi:hypothetical protein